METLTSDPHSAPPGAHFLEFLWTRQTQAISASEAIPIGRLWTARDCYTQDRFFAGPPRIATLVPQVPRTGRARNVSLWLLQTVMLPGVSRDVDISQKCRIRVRNVGDVVPDEQLLGQPRTEPAIGLRGSRLRAIFSEVPAYDLGF